VSAFIAKIKIKIKIAITPTPSAKPAASPRDVLKSFLFW